MSLTLNADLRSPLGSHMGRLFFGFDTFFYVALKSKYTLLLLCIQNYVTQIYILIIIVNYIDIIRFIQDRQERIENMCIKYLTV